MAITTPLAPVASAAVTERDHADVPQYSLGKIGAVWAAAALPMALLSWVLAPLLGDRLGGPDALHEGAPGVPDGGPRLAVRARRPPGAPRAGHADLVADRAGAVAHRAAQPQHRTPRRPPRLIVIALIVATGVEELVPQVHHAVGRDLGLFLDSHAGHVFMAGSWGWFAVIAVMAVFNTVLGEELLFRGLLLPRMNGVFGRRDWLANGVLFAFYHLHVPWAIPATLLDTFIVAYPVKRWRSTWIGIAVHSAQSVFFLGLALHLAMG